MTEVICLKCHNMQPQNADDPDEVCENCGSPRLHVVSIDPTAYENDAEYLKARALLARATSFRP
jgi:predicted amidophosphoribosyltransferase